MININSILGFLKGWNIQYSKEGREKANYYKNNHVKILSVIGNKDRGKSFILSKIAHKNLPSGYSVNTKGLSISFPKYDNIGLLDSVGFESPLLECDGEEYILKSDNFKKNNDIYEKLKILKKEIKELKEKNSNINEIRNKENEFFRRRNDFRKEIPNKEDQIYALTNERRITDFFLQRFIIENANVLLLVVDKLSIDDQFFLNKLTKLVKENNEQFLQNIIVVHNLINMKEIKVVEYYINNTLKKSLTFCLTEKKDLILKNKKPNTYNRIRFLEKKEDSTEKEIIHLIMAQEGTPAGDYYNDSAISHIRQILKVVTNHSQFDVIKKLKDYFIKVSDTILKIDNSKEKEMIKPDNIKLTSNEEKLQLDYKKNLNLETFYGDLITDTFGDPKFTPSYYIISTDPKHLKIYLDCPGKTSITDVNVFYPNQITKIVIKGKREKQTVKTMGRKFGSGDFELKITLKGKDGNISDKVEVEKPINGFYLIKIERQQI